MRVFKTVVAGVAIVVSLAIPASAARATAAGAETSYLVTLRAGASAGALRAAGFHVAQSWPGLRTAQVLASPAALARLRTNGVVSLVEADVTIRSSATTKAPITTGAAGLTWGLQAIKAQAAWSAGITGNGIKVCDLDSGIDFSQPEFAGGVIKGSKNFVSDGHATAADGNGHGTFTAGEIAARLNGSGFAGAAYGVQLYVARVLNDKGEGTTSSLVAGVNWCVNTVHARLLNMSFGNNHPSRTEQQLFATAYSKGALSFAASGNDGSDSIGYPAGYSSVIAVGATDPSNQLADFSDYGSKQELVAPGVDVLSTVPTGTGLQVSVTQGSSSITAHGLQYSPDGTVTGTLVNCGIASSATSCSNPPSSGTWIALIDRGTNTFAQKITNVTTQGAAAAIVVNNDSAHPDDASGFTLGKKGTWIPAVSVSYNDGASIRSSGQQSATVALTPWNYDYEDGTSMSSPYAVAVAALAWSANPNLSNKQIRTILDQSAKDLGTPGRDGTYGYGLVQADKAIQLARSTKA